MSLLSYSSPAIQGLSLPDAGVEVLVLREDQNHAYVSGNKWWKLKYNLQAAVQGGYHTLLTFGGAYSNHIFATAAAGRELGLKTIGVIRGEETLPLNSTLSFATRCGMTLHYVSREAYRNKTDDGFTKELEDRFGDCYLIPEGGTNELAVKGCHEWGEKLLRDFSFDYLCLAVGTGGTLAGLVEAMPESKTVIGFPVLKGAEFLASDIREKLTKPKPNWRLQYDYHFGGYAKSTSELLKFMETMHEHHAIPLDRIYTGKIMFGVLDLLAKGFFKKGSRVLVLHTGGLQGNQ